MVNRISSTGNYSSGTYSPGVSACDAKISTTVRKILSTAKTIEIKPLTFKASPLTKTNRIVACLDDIMLGLFAPRDKQAQAQALLDKEAWTDEDFYQATSLRAYLPERKKALADAKLTAHTQANEVLAENIKKLKSFISDIERYLDSPQKLKIRLQEIGKENLYACPEVRELCQALLKLSDSASSPSLTEGSSPRMARELEASPLRKALGHAFIESGDIEEAAHYLGKNFEHLTDPALILLAAELLKKKDVKLAESFLQEKVNPLRTQDSLTELEAKIILRLADLYADQNNNQGIFDLTAILKNHHFESEDIKKRAEELEGYAHLYEGDEEKALEYLDEDTFETGLDPARILKAAPLLIKKGREAYAVDLLKTIDTMPETRELLFASLIPRQYASIFHIEKRDHEGSLLEALSYAKTEILGPRRIQLARLAFANNDFSAIPFLLKEIADNLIKNMNASPGKKLTEAEGEILFWLASAYRAENKRKDAISLVKFMSNHGLQSLPIKDQTLLLSGIALIEGDKTLPQNIDAGVRLLIKSGMYSWMNDEKVLELAKKIKDTTLAVTFVTPFLINGIPAGFANYFAKRFEEEGNYDQAFAWLQHSETETVQREAAYRFANHMAEKGDFEQAFAWLKRSGDKATPADFAKIQAYLDTQANMKNENTKPSPEIRPLTQKSDHEGA